MPEYQPIDYRLRCHTKRTDLPVDVLRDIGVAYGEIIRLNRDYEALKLRLQELKNGFEGCCTACEPVAEMNKKLRKERDEARREVCHLMRSDDYNEPFDGTVFEYAIHRGWDCFKENTNG